MKPRAARTAPWTASLPELANRTSSAHGTIAWIRSASSTSSVVQVPNIVPVVSSGASAPASSGEAWPSTAQP